MGIRGLHDIPTAHSLPNRSLPATRAQVVTHLARAEHEKARLERELTMWVTNQKQAERRLQRVLERIALLQEALKKHSPRRRRAGRRGLTGSPDIRHREITLEY
jgi:chromosome segregation ATPase